MQKCKVPWYTILNFKTFIFLDVYILLFLFRLFFIDGEMYYITKVVLQQFKNLQKVTAEIIRTMVRVAPLGWQLEELVG